MPQYLIKPLERCRLYEFDPDALIRSGSDRFFQAKQRVLNLLPDGKAQTKAKSPQGAASHIAVRYGAKEFEIGGYIDDILMFGSEESSAYCPGFMNSSVRWPKNSEMRAWLARFYDERDLGITSYPTQPKRIKVGLARRFCKVHKFDFLDIDPDGLSDVESVLKKLFEDGLAPTRRKLRHALRAILNHPNIYTDRQIHTIFPKAEEENELFGEENTRMEYARKVMSGVDVQAEGKETVSHIPAEAVPLEMVSPYRADSPRLRPERWRKGREMPGQLKLF